MVNKVLTYICIVSSLLVGTRTGIAQQGDVHLHKGNKDYAAKDYKSAVEEYQKALSDKSAAVQGKFNLGDAYYKQGQFDQAIEAYKQALALTKDQALMAHAYHNIGNSLLQQKKFDESVKAYENALYNNCKDEDTRYNLAYAQAMLKHQQDQQKKQQQQKKQDQKDQQKQKPQDNKDKDNKDKQNKDQQQQQNDKISKQDAQRMLDALNNDEKNTQNKLQKKKAIGQKQIEKNW
jgi:Ca-activated chloride channel family protein